jgi:hypothetical protein
MSIARTATFAGILVLFGIAAIPARADLLRITDNQGSLVHFCNGGCDLNLFGPPGTTTTFKELTYFIDNSDDPLYSRDVLFILSSGGEPSYFVHFTPERVLCSSSSVLNCDFNSRNSLVVPLEFSYGPGVEPAEYRVTVLFSPEPGTLALTGTAILVVGWRRLRILRHTTVAKKNLKGRGVQAKKPADSQLAADLFVGAA